MKNIFIAAFSLILLYACENRDREEGSTSRAPETETNRDNETTRDRDNNPITGRRDDQNRTNRDDNDNLLNDRSEERIDRSLAMAGRSLFMSECASCHRVTDEEGNILTDKEKKLAGPELTEITDRRNDRWLVKFMTNSDGDDNSNKDADEICNVQKKGKELNRDQALKVLEYLHMRNQTADQQ